jgi:NAD(P)H dehydrogenase (quinone)
LLHLGMVMSEQMRLDEITGGARYGATTIAGGKGERRPSANELHLVRFQARHATAIAARLASD